MIELKCAGGEYGDKWAKKLPNLKLGEFRYYPQDNKNIIDLRLVSSKVALRILNYHFPNYQLDTEEYKNYFGKSLLYIWTIGVIENKHYRPIIINKGYVCIREATYKKRGVVINFHDGRVYVCKEIFRRIRNKKKEDTKELSGDHR
ncbi:MAG TPA: hypothetical protein PLM93_10160 [Sulfuricurvum sp.]|nr:MAG: hypothetical protein B7Y30_08925 [Campylobacterales bacterium 16-40-21]OZA02067.1 MAG: hypothetical protein B7X89_10880 [Sulfuricurvum sp. 17-40-25]HQS67532.1 hypothetical protein [Sulfuricurvum sp.]HQT37097.1 hypothetical protein [Sulfuricurvum sp.]